MTLYLCVLYLSENKQRLVPLTAKPSQTKVLTWGGDLRESQVDVPLSVNHLQHKLIDFYNRDEKCLLRGTNWALNKAVPASSLKG